MHVCIAFPYSTINTLLFRKSIFPINHIKTITHPRYVFLSLVHKYVDVLAWGGKGGINKYYSLASKFCQKMLSERVSKKIYKDVLGGSMKERERESEMEILHTWTACSKYSQIFHFTFGCHTRSQPSLIRFSLSPPHIMKWLIGFLCWNSYSIVNTHTHVFWKCSHSLTLQNLLHSP